MYPQGTRVLYTSPDPSLLSKKSAMPGWRTAYSLNHHIVDEPATVSSSTGEWDMCGLIKFDRPIKSMSHKLSYGKETKGFTYLVVHRDNIKLLV